MNHHPLRPLARNSACQIEMCGGCNVLHVSIGPMTLRLDPTAARRVSAALTEALERLSVENQPVIEMAADGQLVN